MKEAIGSVIMIDMSIYWVMSVALFSIMDMYAAKKLGGKQMLGYKVLRMPKFFSLIFVTGYTVVVSLLCLFADLSVQATTLTFMGIPFFVAWLYYLVTVLRRIRAETKGRFH